MYLFNKDTRYWAKVQNALEPVVVKIHAIDDMKTKLDDLRGTPDALRELKKEIKKQEDALIKEIKASQPPRKKMKREVNNLTMESPGEYFSELKDTFHKYRLQSILYPRTIGLIRDLHDAPWDSSENTLLLHDVQDSFFLPPKWHSWYKRRWSAADALKLDLNSNPIPPNSSGLDLHRVALEAVGAMDDSLMVIPTGIRTKIIKVYDELLSSIVSTVAENRGMLQWSTDWIDKIRPITDSLVDSRTSTLGELVGPAKQLDELVHDDLTDHYTSVIDSTKEIVGLMRARGGA